MDTEVTEELGTASWFVVSAAELDSGPLTRMSKTGMGIGLEKEKLRTLFWINI